MEARAETNVNLMVYYESYDRIVDVLTTEAVVMVAGERAGRVVALNFPSATMKSLESVVSIMKKSEVKSGT